ncbi:MAG TPA: peptide chain release factor N(5)-glutamine methyltransferase [Bacillota bacterium]|nr:peptide chain release factor N(5)-glutamine methyltransferase [Bacillota bacterium]HPF42945.1 peptide chain release factor N(5)-glutamine methyltransferase [Bacillota bacterium]HPJ86425.1 peptide chain release factor N(5)-glutamine methyltransferase [Bacillota bacterium]HPQ62217.1 peptide chain release factor N(5)-glutamine methyltransferase [Bacillota bacterium]HRX92136.1 peptide chain release factor N(5)-glutamine methyltransferase [Candidatus Izemoplasmatales bacterium]
MRSEPTYEGILKKAKKQARQIGLEESAVELLMLEFSGLSQTGLYLHYRDAMPESDQIRFFKALDEYLVKGKPVQYVIGHVSFYGYDFIVNDSVLIPRFETEELVENVLSLTDEIFCGEQNIRVLDIGTGSGCIAIALKKEEPKYIVHATDISKEALEVAKENAHRMKAEIDFHNGDIFKGIPQIKFNVIVSNPPYIPENENVPRIIADNEPSVALYGGDDGLRFHREILKEAKDYLSERFLIAFEHGYDKAILLRNIAKEYFPDCETYTKKDMQGRDRMTFVVKR